ncbi:hypothetical protein DESAMIL20_330 [Desulfurella amilsii]|uniref:Uncharacterized protein n=1 Tax=Desulfurella amilsii TaxID=1562698 RepID=A0A1X4XZ25_9BACT|nr:hypothetical protein [Desulfurella amilsii]OSS42774.1 hypothetical protein DESAMIL20_403 [Desulfurella amilsii]OSS42849.1 hypothetical protein DESAMIL20_330 [Desulfurella amilsii]
MELTELEKKEKEMKTKLRELEKRKKEILLKQQLNNCKNLKELCTKFILGEIDEDSFKEAVKKITDKDSFKKASEPVT